MLASGIDNAIEVSVAKVNRVCHDESLAIQKARAASPHQNHRSWVRRTLRPFKTISLLYNTGRQGRDVKKAIF